jgi:hypothetical protein
MNTPMTDRDHAAVCKSLDTIEAAQQLILSAAQDLCPIPGMANEWTAICKLHDVVKAKWHRVNARRAWLCNPTPRRQRSKGGVA